MKVLVLLGGESREREISLLSGRSVIKACKDAGHEVSEYDPANGFEGLRSAVENVDVVLPILHGDNGEDGVIQEQLEQLGAKYLGTDSTHSRIAIDKVKTHELLESEGIAMPEYEFVDLEGFENSELSKRPFVLKPHDGGSTVDSVIVREITGDKMQQCRDLFQKYEKMLLEELIEGMEITVPVLDGEALPPILIIPPEGGEFDYDNKYNGKSQEICPIPEGTVSREIQESAKQLILRVHKALGARHLSRSEVIIRPNGELIVLELNTIPGMTEQSLLPVAAQAIGMSWATLADKLVAMAADS